MSERPANTIWQEIQRFAAPCEIDSLYSTIGPDIIEENEALYAEASTLAEILDQFTASGNTEKRKVRPPPEHPSKKFLEVSRVNTGMSCLPIVVGADFPIVEATKIWIP